MAKEHDDAAHGDAPKQAHTIHAQKSEGGGAMKWIAGAAVAALLVGGGYYLWSKPSAAPQQQTAMSETFDNSSATPSPVSETASGPAETSSAAPRRAPSSAPAEEVVGVTPASAMAGDDDIIVQGARRPVWAQHPNARRLSESYPYRALEAGQEGEARVSCMVGQSGALSCVKVSETPANAGFGSAAVHVAQMYRHADLRADGTPAAGTPVHMRVLFRQGEDARSF